MLDLRVWPQTLVSQDIIKLALCLTTHVEGWCSSSCPNARNPQVGWGTPHHFRGYEGITEHLRSSFNVWSLILLRQKCSIKQLLMMLILYPDVPEQQLPRHELPADFVLPADEVCRMAPVCRRRCAQGKKDSVQLVWTDVFTGRTGEGSWVHIPHILSKNMFQQWSKKSWNPTWFIWYCWWFRNPANQLRLVVYPIIPGG